MAQHPARNPGQKADFIDDFSASGGQDSTLPASDSSTWPWSASEEPTPSLVVASPEAGRPFRPVTLCFRGIFPGSNRERTDHENASSLRSRNEYARAERQCRIGAARPAAEQSGHQRAGRLLQAGSRADGRGGGDPEAYHNGSRIVGPGDPTTRRYSRWRGRDGDGRWEGRRWRIAE